MGKAMIVSVGGSPAALIKSLAAHRPAFVCFFASKQSVEMVPQIRAAAGCAFLDDKVLTADAEDLLICYAAASAAADLTEGRGYGAGEIVVDYTGGTKSMTAALVLATVARGYSFSYVGGDERNKGGLGTVVNGHERVVHPPNPWQMLAVEEQRRLSWLVNHGQFAAAQALLSQVGGRARQDARLGRVFACLADVVAGFAAWDRFGHREAGDRLRKGLTAVEGCAVLLQDPGLQSFCREAAASLAFFNRLYQAMGGFSRSSEPGSHARVCDELVIDLIANAERRAVEGKFDDAVARLYRALEMAAQAALQARKRPIYTAEVPLDQVPEPLRDEFARRYATAKPGIVEIPLLAAYQLLAALGHPLGERFAAREGRMRGLLWARNNSILGHGLTPLDAGAYESLLAALLDLLELRREDLPRFPRLELELIPAMGGRA